MRKARLASRHSCTACSNWAGSMAATGESTPAGAPVMPIELADTQRNWLRLRRKRWSNKETAAMQMSAFGTKRTFGAARCDVRFWGESGHWLGNRRCPLLIQSGLVTSSRLVDHLLSCVVNYDGRLEILKLRLTSEGGLVFEIQVHAPTSQPRCFSNCRRHRPDETFHQTR